jgi:glycosyltransferase involved in cell wall biosynthesis
MKRILFVLESFFPHHRAGTEVYVLNLCRYFYDKGWDVGVLISTTSHISDYDYEGIKVLTFPIPEAAIAKELNGIIPPRGIDAFIGRVKEFCPDIVHFHSFGRAINSFHLMAVKKMGIKTAFTPHLGSFFCIKGDLLLNGKSNCDGFVSESRCLNCLFRSQGKGKLISALMACAVITATKLDASGRFVPAPYFRVRHRQRELDKVKQNTDSVFAIARWIKKAFDLNGVVKSILIPQGITPVFFSLNQRHEESVNVNFAFVGRMHSSKGFHLLMDAWERLDIKDSKLLVFTSSSGGENDYYSKNKLRAGQFENISWNESVSQSQLAQEFAKIDVLILPSVSNEVSPLVIQEAAAYSIPTIGSDYIAIKDMIEHGVNGLLFKNGDADDLRLQMQAIIDNPELVKMLGSNIVPPVSMTEVSEIIEKEYLKLFE